MENVDVVEDWIAGIVSGFGKMGWDGVDGGERLMEGISCGTDQVHGCTEYIDEVLVLDG